jgi:Tfp pilus assembly protein PilO
VSVKQASVTVLVIATVIAAGFGGYVAGKLRTEQVERAHQTELAGAWKKELDRCSEYTEQVQAQNTAALQAMQSYCQELWIGLA